MEKVRLNKRKCQQGLDGMNLELILGLEDEHLYLPLEELKNEAGNTIVSLECIGGKVKAYVGPTPQPQTAWNTSKKGRSMV